MPVHLQDLPNEVLSIICQNLSKVDVKEARLACVRWSNIGAETLFQRVYFAPRLDIMQKFADITSHPIFNKTIREVVYDSALFQSRYLDEQVFKAHFERYHGQAFDYHGMTSEFGLTRRELQEELHRMMTDSSGNGKSSARFLHNLAQYKICLAEQEAILSNGRDYDILCAGLNRMRQITTVSLLCRFPSFDYLPLSDVSHDWYETYLASIYSGVIAPSHWDEWHNTRLEDIPVAYEEHDWDCRGISHLLQAVSRHCNSIKELQIGTAASSAPLMIFWPSSTDTSCLQHIVQKLSCLQVFCTANLRAGAEDVSEEVAGLANILAKTSKLEVLSMSLSGPSRQWIHLVGDSVRPNLKVLDLGDLEFTLPDFLAVVKGSQPTLRRLQLRNVWLTSGTSWRVLADKLGELLQLNRVTLLGLVSAIHHRLTLDGVPDVAKRMMAWADVGKIKVDTINHIYPAVVVCVDQNATPSAEGSRYRDKARSQCTSCSAQNTMD